VFLREQSVALASENFVDTFVFASTNILDELSKLSRILNRLSGQLSNFGGLPFED